MTATALQPKTKYPLATAQAVAAELVHALQPACARLAVAGSVRRCKAQVGDIELVYVPRFADRPSPIANSQVDLFQTKSVRVNQVDLVLADLNIPQMSGIELIHQMRQQKNHSGVPVVMVTTESSPTRIKELLSEGVRDYLHKPFTPEEFRSVISRHLGVLP